MSSPVNTVVEQSPAPSRRAFLRGVGGAFAAAAVLPVGGAVATPVCLNVALSDRTIGHRGGVESFAIAKAIGANAVEVDFGRLGSGPTMLTALNTSEGRQHLLDAAVAQDQTVRALAMNVWRGQSFADHPRAVEFTIDAIHAATAIGASVVTLPIAHAEDLAVAGVPDRCVENLKQLAPVADAAGITLALDIACPPAVMKRLLNAVGSSAVSAAVPTTSVESIAEAFDVLGAHCISQFRISFDGSPAQAQQLLTLRDVGSTATWAGWVMIDRLVASPDDLQAVGKRAVALLSGALTVDFS